MRKIIKAVGSYITSDGGDGSIASLLTGAWMPVNLENGAAAGAVKE
ncbi:hypothetical protein [Bifidobacterium felsineum]|nr:hypothetical protein [Bifidobacterium felsineum]MBT1163059.1 hypothetical protein [Bifidobacterium felsineum]